jgi:hypothetical protein
MPFEASYLNSIASHGRGILSQMGLVDENGAEITGGAYARITVSTSSWTAPVNGDITLTNDKVFEVPAGATVAGWFITLTSTGVAGITGTLTPETFVNGGQYRFVAANCTIRHDNLGE